MTTTVTIKVEHGLPCDVSSDHSPVPTRLQPGQSTTLNVWNGNSIKVVEVYPILTGERP